LPILFHGAGFGRDLRRRLLARIEIHDVDLHCAHVVAPGFHFLDPIPGLGVAGRVGRHHLYVHAGQLEADRLAQSAHAPGYHRNAFRHVDLSIEKFLIRRAAGAE
jgi:hypothetical protein